MSSARLAIAVLAAGCLAAGCSSSAQERTTPANTQFDRPLNLSDADIPPLPAVPYPLARPPEVVRAVFAFAARHPEVLNHIPCFCGCQARGHKNNDDCFVAERDARGRPTAWEAHGLG
jgi:Protein of unknown function with PCYCGC motif